MNIVTSYPTCIRQLITHVWKHVKSKICAHQNVAIPAMEAILDFPTFHHQTEYLNGFPMSEDIEKRVPLMFLPCLVNNMCILIHFTPTMVDILDSHMFHHQTEYGNGFLMSENIENHVLFRFISCLVKKDMDIDKFTSHGGGHLGFRDFEALVAIFQLGIQQICIQHPLKKTKKLVCQKFAQNASITFNTHIFWNPA